MAECWSRQVVDAVRVALRGDGGLELLRTSRRIVHGHGRGARVSPAELARARLVLEVDRELDRERERGLNVTGPSGEVLLTGNSSPDRALFRRFAKGVVLC